MMKVAAFALIAAVTGQVEETTTISGSDGDLIVERRQAITVVELSTTVAALSTLISSGDGPASAVARDMAERTMGLQADVTENSVLMTRLTSDVTNQLRDAAAVQTAALSSALSTAMSSQTVALADIRAENEQLREQLQDALAASSSTTTAAIAAVTRSTEAAQTAQAASITAVNRTLVGMVATKGTAIKHMWIGGCSAHQNGGWNDACLDRNELNTAAPFFRKASNTRMAAIKAGVFRMNFFTMNNSCNWAHTQAIVNGEVKIYTHLHTRYSWWKDQHTDVTFYAAAGQAWYFKTHAACGHTSKHHTSGNGRYHERQEFEWKGFRDTNGIR